MIPRALIGPLRAVLPDADLDAATHLGEGWALTAYRVADPGGDLVVRVLRDVAGSRYPQALEVEVRLLALLAVGGLFAPRDARLITDGAGVTIGAVQRLIEGEALPRSQLRGARRALLARQLGEFLTRLHGFDLAVARAAGVPERDLWEDAYAHHVRLCDPFLGPRSREWLGARVERFLAEGGMDGAPRTLVHADFAPVHLRVDAGGLAGVIDFNGAEIADPAIDFAGLLRAFREPFMEAVLACYDREIDPHLRRRARFYVDLMPAGLIRFGDRFNDGQDRIDGLRQIAARAAAATRRAAR